MTKCIKKTIASKAEADKRKIKFALGVLSRGLVFTVEGLVCVDEDI
jgi:hypothetical protein